jgi:multiple sugar transport system substrate-binding protein
MAYETVGPYLKTADGELLNADGTRATAADSAGTVAAVTLLQDIVKTGALPPGQSNMTEDTMNQLFAQGKLAFMVGGPWERPTILKDNPNAKYGKEFATTPIPAQQTGGKSASTSGGWQIGISATGKNPDAAKALVAFIERPDNLNAIAASSTFPPLTVGLDSEPWKSDPFYEAFKAELPNSGLPIPPVPQLAQVAAALQKNVAPALLSGTSAHDALAAFDTQVNQQILRR